MPWEKQGSGCDKAFYWDGNDKDGWLNFNDEKVKKAELASRNKLNGMKDVIPDVDQSRKAPALPQGVTALGYYIRRVNLGLTIKPQMNWMAVMPKVKKELAAVNEKEKIASLKGSLQYIHDKCDLICNEVGELTLGIDKGTGKAYLLDLAKTNGQAGGADQAISAKKGLNKMISLLA